MAEEKNEPNNDEPRDPETPAYEVEGPAQKVTDQPTGAKRDSYFKRRDYA
jgi:hypothetical protein